MRVRLPYGHGDLQVELPDRNVTVVAPRPLPGLPDEAAAIRAALRAPLGTAPLRELVRRDDTVAIVFSDGTRPQPRERMLPVLLEELAHVPRERIVLVNALGTHRPNTPQELEAMLGGEIARGYRIVQHDACDRAAMVPLGPGQSGREVWVNAEYMRATVRVLTGFIEPHFFAGYSGGPKAVLPGLVDQATVLANHAAPMLEHPRATWGVTAGNPVWEEMRAVALRTAPAFVLNVALNRERAISGVFAGALEPAHAAGCAFVARSAMVPVPGRSDIVITSNSGYPLDQNLYQAVKGMSAAAQVVRPGGSIIIAAECCDGLPDHRDYAAILQLAPTPQALLALIRSWPQVRQDQWEAQLQAQVQLQADVYVRSSYLGEGELRRAMLQPCESIERTVASLLERYGPDATICVLPEGPMTIPYVR